MHVAKTYFFYCLLVTGFCFIYCPKEVFSQKEDISSINRLLDKAEAYIPDALDSARQLLSDMESKDLDLYQRAQLYRLKGLTADYAGQTEQAIGEYNKGIRLIEGRPKFRELQASLLINIGVAHYFSGDFGSALEAYIKAESFCEKAGLLALRAKCLNNMAIIYSNSDRFKEAVDIYKESVGLKAALQDSIGLANSLNNLAIAYGRLNDYASSLDYARRAEDIYRALGEEAEAVSVALTIGSSLYEMGRKDEAETYIMRAMKMANQKYQLHQICGAYVTLAEIQHDKGNYYQSLKYLAKIEDDLMASDFDQIKLEFLKMKSSSLYMTDQNRKAFEVLDQSRELSDTLQAMSRLKLEQEMQTKYLTLEKERQIEAQEFQLNKSRRQRIFLIVALLAALIILILVYRLYSIRMKANRLLNKKNAQIQKALEEKEILLKEIHHRVKNNLQLISSLLNLQSRQVDDPHVHQAIKDGQNRVKSMALIHQSLYQDSDLIAVHVPSYVDKLSAALQRSFANHANGPELELKVEDFQMDVDQIIPLGLILNELFTNAFKYAFSDPAQGKITLCISRKNGQINLSFSDNGKGLPEDFDPKESSSLGYKLIFALANKLKAKLDIDSDETGTTILIGIPKA